MNEIQITKTYLIEDEYVGYNDNNGRCEEAQCQVYSARALSVIRVVPKVALVSHRIVGKPPVHLGKCNCLQYMQTNVYFIRSSCSENSL